MDQSERTQSVQKRKKALAEATKLVNAAAALMNASTIEDVKALKEIRKALHMIDSEIEDIIDETERIQKFQQSVEE